MSIGNYSHSKLLQIITENAAAPGDSITLPGSSNDNAIVRWNGAAGSTIQNSSVTIDDSNNLAGVATIQTSGDVTVGGNLAGVATIQTSGDVTVGTDANRTVRCKYVTASHGLILGSTSPYIKSSGSVYVLIDTDNNSDSNKFHIVSNSSAIVATINEAGDMDLDGCLRVHSNYISGSGGACISMDDGNNLGVRGNLHISGGVIYGPTDGALSINSDTNMQFRIDQDNDGTAYWQWYNGTDTNVAYMDESGNFFSAAAIQAHGGLVAQGANNTAATVLMQADQSDDAGDDWTLTANTDQSFTIGNDIASAGTAVAHMTITPHASAANSNFAVAGSLKVGGNVMQASDGGSTITMDTSDNVTIGGNLTLTGDELIGVAKVKDGGGNTVFDLASGKCGIGVSPPECMLNIKNISINPLADVSDTARYHLLLQGASSTGYGAGLAFGNSAGNVGSAIIFKDAGGYAKGELQFYTKTSTSDGAAPVQRMTITHDGNVGIGTTDPGALLEVRGPTGTGTAPAGVLRLSTAETSIVNADQLGRIEFIAPEESSGSDSVLVGASIYAEADDTFDASTNDTDLIFATGKSAAAAERVRIDSDGNVGIGTTTPGTWGRLEVHQDTDDDESGITAANSSGNRAMRMYCNSSNQSIINSGDGGQQNLVLNEGGGTVTLGTAGNSSFPLHVIDEGDCWFVLSRHDSSITSGEQIGGIGFGGTENGSNYDYGAHIRAFAGGSWSVGSDIPTYLTFSTVPDGGTSTVEHLRISYDGTLTATDTTISSNSDARLKEGVQDWSGGLDIIKQLEPKTFRFINQDVHKKGQVRGFVAQDVLAVDNYWVGEQEIHAPTEDFPSPDYELLADTNGRAYTLKLGEIDAMYVSAIKEMLQKIEALENKVSELENG